MVCFEANFLLRTIKYYLIWSDLVLTSRVYMYKCKHGASFLSNMFRWSRSDFEESLDDLFVKGRERDIVGQTNTETVSRIKNTYLSSVNTGTLKLVWGFKEKVGEECILWTFPCAYYGLFRVQRYHPKLNWFWRHGKRSKIGRKVVQSCLFLVLRLNTCSFCLRMKVVVIYYT